MSKEWDHYTFVMDHYYPVVKSFAAPVNFIDEEKEFADYPVIIAPPYQLPDAGLVEKWKACVEQGGHLILGARTGSMNRDGQLWQARRSEPIVDLIGAESFVFDSIPSPKGRVIIVWHYGNIQGNHKHYEPINHYVLFTFAGTVRTVRKRIA